MLILLCVFWGMTFPATKAALDVTDPIHFLTLRFGLAAIVLLPFMVFRKRSSKKKSSEHGNSSGHYTGFKALPAWQRGALIGLFLLIGFTLQVAGLKYTTASRSGFFTSLLTILAPIFAWTFRTSKTHWATWVGLIPAITGIYLLADPDSGGLNKGDLLTIGCAVAFALQMVVLEALARDRDDVWELTYAQIIVIGSGALTWSFIAGNSFHITPVGWAAAGYTAIFGSIIAVWLQTRFQPTVPAGHAALIFTFEPVFASILAWLLLGDSWTTRALIGAGFILGAMLLSTVGLYRKK